MTLEKTIRFERHADGGNELRVFEDAFRPIMRLRDYPDLIESLPNLDVSDFDTARRIANTFARTDGASSTELLPFSYLRKARAVLSLLGIALERDQTLDYAPTPPIAVALLLDARRSQREAIAPAIELLDRALALTAPALIGGADVAV